MNQLVKIFFILFLLSKNTFSIELSPYYDAFIGFVEDLGYETKADIYNTEYRKSFYVITNNKEEHHLCRLTFVQIDDFVDLTIDQAPGKAFTRELPFETNNLESLKEPFQYVLGKLLSEYDVYQEMLFPNQIMLDYLTNIQLYYTELSRYGVYETYNKDTKEFTLSLKSMGQVIARIVTKFDKGDGLNNAIYKTSIHYGDEHLKTFNHVFNANSKTSYYNIYGLLKISGNLITAQDFFDDFLNIFPSSFKKISLQTNQIELEGVQNNDLVALIDVDFKQYVLIVRTNKDQYIDSNTIFVHKVNHINFEDNKYQLEPTPVYQEKFYKQSKKSFAKIINKQDWEKNFEVLGYVIGEQFKQSYRRRYSSLYEYKDCDLQYDINEIKDYMFSTYTKRTLNGKDNNKKLHVISFSFVNKNEYITLKMHNKLMDYQYVYEFYKSEYSEKAINEYIDTIIKINAANAMAEQFQI